MINLNASLEFKLQNSLADNTVVDWELELAGDPEGALFLHFPIGKSEGQVSGGMTQEPSPATNKASQKTLGEIHEGQAGRSWRRHSC